MTDAEIFLKNLNEHRETAAKMDVLARSVAEAGSLIRETLANGGRVMFCGNGGSAADAQHLAAELSGRYLKNRRPLAGLALHCDTSALTAIANDFSFDEIYSRQVKAHGRKGDLLVGISTSGNSKNVLNAMLAACELEMKTVAMTGESGGKMAEIADVLLNIPSSFTPRIQEMHILIGHTLCEAAEKDF